MTQCDRCPTCVEIKRRYPDIHEEEPGYQCPDCGGSGDAADAISFDDSLHAPRTEPKPIGYIDLGPRSLRSLLAVALERL